MKNHPLQIDFFPSWWPCISMAFFGVIFKRKNAILSEQQIYHQMVHLKQQKELLYLPFLLLYFLEFIVRFLIHENWKKAHQLTSFEADANLHNNATTFPDRKPYAWLKSKGVLPIYLTITIALSAGAYFTYQKLNTTPPEELEILVEKNFQGIETKYAKDIAFKEVDLLPISADEYIQAHDNNAIQAAEKYKEKPLVIEGTIRMIEIVGEGITNTGYIMLTGSQYNDVVHASFPTSELETLSTLQKGQTVALKCVGNSLGAVPSVNNCKLISAN